MPDQDTDLMLRASRGEDSAFRELFDRHYRRAVNIAYRSTGDPDTAEDIAMEAFARIYEARGSFKPMARFTTYLYRVVANLSINVAKRKRVISCVNLDDHDHAAAGCDPAEIAEQTELGKAVREAVLNLPANQRMALILTRYEELSYQDSAEIMGISVGALESLLHRAKENLRKSLGPFVRLD